MGEVKAKIKYLPNTYEILEKGDYVECAVSNKKIPLIIDALVNLDCSLIKKFNVGDHYIFICKINYLKINDSKKPMIYFKNKYL